MPYGTTSAIKRTVTASERVGVSTQMFCVCLACNKLLAGLWLLGKTADGVLLAIVLHTCLR